MKRLRLQRGPRQMSGVAHTASTVGYLHRHTSPTAPIAVHEVEARSTKEQPARAAGPIGIANWQPRGHFCTQIASPAPFLLLHRLPVTELCQSLYMAEKNSQRAFSPFFFTSKLPRTAEKIKFGDLREVDRPPGGLGMY